jgi:hypothetical protein
MNVYLLKEYKTVFSGFLCKLNNHIIIRKLRDYLFILISNFKFKTINISF